MGALERFCASAERLPRGAIAYRDAHIAYDQEIGAGEWGGVGRAVIPSATRDPRPASSGPAEIPAALGMTTRLRMPYFLFPISYRPGISGHPSTTAMRCAICVASPSPMRSLATMITAPAPLSG